MQRGAWLVVAVALLVAVGIVALAWWDPPAFRFRPGGGPGGGGNGTVDTSYQIIDYTSSVDGHPLSYAVWNPPGYSAGGSYPFMLFLHGVESTNGCVDVSGYGGGASMIDAGNAAGWIVGSLCTRIADGWYANSPATGPEETDVLDAIAHERNVTHVTAVYLVGMSMGSNGALSIATNHPSEFTGVAGVAACPDMFQESAYFLTVRGGLPPGFGPVTGSTSAPAPGSVGYGIEYHLSAFRFYSQNLSGLRIYVDAGGADQTCIDNTSFWPWMQANNTVLTSSCNVATATREPSECSTPIAALAASHPGEYTCRFVYEPSAPHTFDQLNGPDLIAFFQGAVSAGTFTASIGGTPSPDPSATQA